MYLSRLLLKPGSFFFKAHIHKNKDSGVGVGEMTTSQVPRQKTSRINGSWLRRQAKAKTRNQSTRNLRTETTHMCKSGKGKGRSWNSTGPPSAAPCTADSPQKQGATLRTRQSAVWEFSFVFWGWLSMNCWMTGKLRWIWKLQEQVPGRLTGGSKVHKALVLRCWKQPQHHLSCHLGWEKGFLQENEKVHRGSLGMKILIGWGDFETKNLWGSGGAWL